MLLLPYLIIAFYTAHLNTNGNERSIPLWEVSSKISFSPETKMYLTGSTNLVSYRCDCLTPGNTVPISVSHKGTKTYFENTNLKVNAQNINCHQRLYNYNIKKALQTDLYPNINIKLLEAWKTDNSTFLNEKDWFDVISNTNLTIKQTTRNMNVKGKAMRISSNKYRIKGTQELSMKDFNVNVPEIMFGLITVNDKIVFNFDLVFEILK